MNQALTLAEIERRLLAEGYSRQQVDATLAFVVMMRETLARWRQMADDDTPIVSGGRQLPEKLDPNEANPPEI